MATYPEAAFPMTQEGSSSSDFRYPAWQREYEASLVELDPKKLLERVHKAEAAIFNRLQEMAQSSGSSDNKAERQAIEDALANLRVLQRENLRFPDWKKD
ncbi:MAG: hypothetical protein DMG88_18265 [Acidobacteria bacterium]|nr:MAG: hypothetical protein DMG88_18265 [Acidobacteriota bacterium]